MFLTYLLEGQKNKLTANNIFFLFKNLLSFVGLEGVLIWFDNFHHIRWSFSDMKLFYTKIARETH